MNRQQIIDTLKGLTVAGGPVALLVSIFVGGGPRADQIVGAIGGVVSIIGVVWTIFDATRANTALKAASLEGVQVHVNPATADPTVTAVAYAEPATKTDPVADVVLMDDPPRSDR